jgi:hypothetical protein
MIQHYGKITYQGVIKKIMTSIQNKVDDNYIWVSADETTDV